jgi:hypothetical protein
MNFILTLVILFAGGSTAGSSAVTVTNTYVTEAACKAALEQHRRDLVKGSIVLANCTSR